MDAAQVLRELWRRKWWLAVAAIAAAAFATTVAFNVSFRPLPHLQSKSFEYGAATSQLVLDSAPGPLVDIRGDLEPLAIRAQAYSQLIETPEVLKAVAQRLRISPDRITALAAGAGQQVERSNRVVAEQRVFRLSTSAGSDLPFINLFAQAPSRDEALAFVDAVVVEFKSYLERQQRARGVPVGDRVQVRSLGPAQGGTVNEGADRTIVLLTLIGGFLAGCFAIVTISGIANSWRTLNRMDASGAQPFPADGAIDAMQSGLESAYAGSNGNGASSAADTASSGGATHSGGER